MADTTIEHIHQDLEQLKVDVAVIKHVLSEEGKLTEEAERDLEEARATPEEEYISIDDLEKEVG